MTYYKHGQNEGGEVETPFVTGKVYFEIHCAVCNYGLCFEISILKSPRRHQNIIMANPCPRCLEAARLGVEVEVIPMNGEYQTRKVS